MFGVANPLVRVGKNGRGEECGPAVTRVTGHDAKIVRKEFLFSNPFRYDGSESR
jgi:hypothetical protein